MSAGLPVLVVGSGLRSVFHWQDNYFRFSAAREAADAATREEALLRAVTRIEQGEMTTWAKLAAEKPRT